MHTIIPDEIAQNESLTHVLFYPDDVKKSTFWVKSKAFLPPPRSPGEVSFNRACYIPDEAQKSLAKKIERRSKPRCFLRMTIESLNNALIKLANSASKVRFSQDDETAYFKYTPIYDIDKPGKWPDDVDKKWGNGYNPAHVDLIYTMPYQKDEPNEFLLLLAKILTTEKNGYCEVLCEEEEDLEANEWGGEKLCKK